MLSRVVIKNFKSIGDTGVDLALKPLTLLVGPNGAGKSSILEAIAVGIQRHFSASVIQFPSWESLLNRQGGSTACIEIYLGGGHARLKPGYRVTFTTTGMEINHLPQGTEINETEINRLTSALHQITFPLSAVRGDVPYSTSVGGGPQWVGVHGENLLMLLNLILPHRRHKDVADRIVKWASRFGVSELHAGLRGGGQAGSDYLDSELKAVLDLALASTGARQILTVITQLFWSPEGSLLLIEEPEISLHPKGQIDVLEMFAEAIHEGNRQIIATTHSVFMLQALGYAVLKGWLTPDQMAVYHVEKGKEGTTATLLPLSEKGYIEDWVPSFAEVERDLMREWAKSLPRE